MPDAHLTVKVTKEYRSRLSAYRSWLLAAIVFILCSFVHNLVRGEEGWAIVNQFALAVNVWLFCRTNG